MQGRRSLAQGGRPISPVASPAEKHDLGCCGRRFQYHALVLLQRLHTLARCVCSLPAPRPAPSPPKRSSHVSPMLSWAHPRQAQLQSRRAHELPLHAQLCAASTSQTAKVEAGPRGGEGGAQSPWPISDVCARLRAPGRAVACCCKVRTAGAARRRRTTPRGHAAPNQPCWAPLKTVTRRLTQTASLRTPCDRPTKVCMYKGEQVRSKGDSVA